MAPKFNFLKSTLIFSIIGLFIPVFTAIGLLLIQMFLSKFRIECSVAWEMIFYSSIGCAIIFPVLFCRHIMNLEVNNSQSLRLKLIVFNIVEYIFIQASIGSLFTNGNALCYANGGQNGIELIFSGWFAIPILLIFSAIFSFVYSKQNTDYC